MDSVERAKNFIQCELECFSALFRPGAKITIIMRMPNEPTQEMVVMTEDETIEEVMAVLERSRGRI